MFLLTSEYTLSSSVMIKAVNVIVIMLVNDSLKTINAESIITQPWNIDFQTHIKKVFVDSERPFCRVLYSGGNFMTACTGTSSSKTSEKTGKFVYRVA